MKTFIFKCEEKDNTIKWINFFLSEIEMCMETKKQLIKMRGEPMALENIDAKINTIKINLRELTNVLITCQSN